MDLRYISESHLPDFFFNKDHLLPIGCTVLVESGPMRVKICLSFRDEVKIMTKMLPSTKSRILHYRLSVCEYNLSVCSATGNFTQRPYSEWGNDHIEMIAIKWSGISCYGRYFPVWNSTNEKEDTSKCTYKLASAGNNKQNEVINSIRYLNLQLIDIN